MTEWLGKQVLITGGAGFIGSHLAERLVDRGANVTILGRHAVIDNPNLAHFASKLELLPLNIAGAVQHIHINRFEVIFHLGGNPYVPRSVLDPVMDFEDNLHTTFTLLELLRSDPSPRLIYGSSAAVYGNPKHLPIRESDPTQPISPYGVSKLACEHYLNVYSQLYGVKGSSARMFSVYGPRQRKQVIFDILRKLLANPDKIEIYGDGSQKRDFCYVDDAVNALLLIAQHAPGQGEVYNIASGVSHSIQDVVDTWCHHLKLQPELCYTGYVRAGEPEGWTVDINALRALGYEPQIALDEGIERIKEWYNEFN